MPILREVITRFKFDTDEAGAKKIERRTNSMKRGVRTLTRLFGIGLGVASVRSLFKMGTALDQTRFNMLRFSNINIQRMQQQFKSIQGSMENIRKGSGGVLRLKDFFTAGGQFFKAFGQGERQTKDFRRTFEFAAKLSAVTGRNVNEIFQNISQGIESGDFSFLAEVPGFTRTRIQRIQDILQAIDPGEFGGEAGRQQRLRAFLGEASRSSSVINKNLSSVPDAILKANKAATSFKSTMDNIGRTMTTLLVPALEKLNVLLDKFLKISEQAEKKGLFRALISGPASNLKRDLSPKSLNARSDSLLKRLRSGQVDPRRTIVPPSLISKARQMGPLPGGERSIIFNNSFTINGATDPEAVSREVKRKFNQSIQDAGRALVPTEDR